jgi:chromosome segregation ATPase
MGKPTLQDIVKGREALEKELADYDKDAKGIDTRINKIMMEYGTIKKGLEEGFDHIASLKDELKASFATWQKMSGKLDQIKDKLADVHKEVKATLPGLGKFDDQADALSKDLARCGGDMKELKAEDAELKNVKKLAARLTSDYNNLFDSSGGIPKDPPAPTLAVA